MIKHKIFLGGDCVSDWRKAVEGTYIPNTDVFNPVLSNWTPELERTVVQPEKESCSIHLYVFSAAMTGSYSIAEMIDSVHQKKVVIVYIITEGYTKEALANIRLSCELAQKRGAFLFTSSTSENIVTSIKAVLGIGIEMFGGSRFGK